MKLKRMYAEIAKVEPQQDGTLKVFGYASSGAVDSDGEIITPDAMKAALPDYMKFGAVREMHQQLAAGTAIEAKVEDDGKTWFGAHVVDPIAVKKVETGVYKGFSIGGRVIERDMADRNVIKALDLVEISLVDRPANPEAVITVFKAERTAEDDVAELAELLDAGTVTPAQVLALIKAAKDAEAASSASVADDAAKAAAADPSGDITKAGARFSSQTKAALAEIHQAMTSCCDKMEALGYKEPDDPNAEPDADDKVARAAAVDDLAKLAGELDVVKGDLAKITGERDALAKRVAELEALPAPGKALLKAIAKGDDVGDASSVKKSAVEALPAGAKPEEIAKAQLIDMYRASGATR